MTEKEEIEIQRRYYKDTAEQYSNMHIQADDEHYFALSLLSAMLEHYELNSVLDIGSGTGRAISYLIKKQPSLNIVGIEPSKELREIGYHNGISKSILIDGDATNLPYPDGTFDVVCEFGVLHHIKDPAKAISEMLRVSKSAIFISDDNHFGAGSLMLRTVKQLLAAVGLWGSAYWLKSLGKGYRISEGDGLSYPYSVFDNYKMIKEKCRHIHIMNTKNGSVNLYRTAGHIALFGIK